MADTLAVVDGGLLTTVQDLGRWGYQNAGVSPAGAMDRDRLGIANALVGNDPAEAALEITLSGPALDVAADACRLALAGDFAVTVNDRPVPAWTAIDLCRGDRVRVLAARTGLRGYLAVAGGFALPPTLGSLSTHVRTATGGADGRALAAGDVLPLRAARPAGPRLALDPPPPAPERKRTVRVMAGPQGAFFPAAGWETFLGTDWVVSPRSDRMGCRLDGPAIEHADGFNIVSDGIVEGSIQVPGSGLPIVLLVDRQSTGGYAKIATVIGADLGAFAQARPGDIVRFERVDDETAVQARREARDAFERTLRRIAPLRDTGPPDVDALFAANLAGGAVSATADPFD